MDRFGSALQGRPPFSDSKIYLLFRESSVEINELEETDFDDDESSKTTETVIHNSSHSSNLEVRGYKRLLI